MFYDILDKKAIVACSVCGNVHLVDSETYIAFYGNVTVGLRGGIIGDNFRNDGTLKRVTILCRNKKCFNNIFDKEFFEKTTNKK